MAQHNRAALLNALSQYQHQLDQLKALIAADEWDALHQALSEAQAARPAYVAM